MGRIGVWNVIMTNSHRPIIAAFIAIVLITGSIGTALAGVQDCLPKACCCTKGGHKAASHMLPIDTKTGCAANAPCCRIEPAHLPQDIAALATRPELPGSKELLLAMIPGQQFSAHPPPSAARAFQHNGKPKAPLVPLYLETQMLLC
jgi:hypothetical protein